MRERRERESLSFLSFLPRLERPLLAGNYRINAFSQFEKSALNAWSFRVISNSDEKPRSVYLPVLVLINWAEKVKDTFHYRITDICLYDK